METNRLSMLLGLTTGTGVRLSRAQETMLATLAVAASLALAAFWGIAAGSSSAQLAAANAYKVPMVILLSALTALPAGVVALRLTSAKLTALELASSFASSIFGGTLVLATLAPLVAIYYHTSSKAGVPLAVGSVFAALSTGAILFARAVKRRAIGGASLFAVGVLVAVFVAALLQYVAIAAPIIGEGGRGTVTRFDGGFDSMFGR